MLRDKLEKSEGALETAEKALSDLRTMRNSEVESALLKSDVERIKLQKELSLKTEALTQLQEGYKKLDEKFRQLETSSARSTMDFNDMQVILESERKAKADLEARLSKTGGQTAADSQVRSLIWFA